MATYYSQGSGLWSTLTNWDTNAGGGGSDPASVAAMEDNLFIIQAGHVIDFDIDTSAWTTGFQTITIQGHATTPGTLRCDSTTLAAGTYNVKMKTGYSIVGTSGTEKGRILANSNGTWDATGVLANDRKFIISTLTGSSAVATVDATYLEIQLWCTDPTDAYVETYGVPFVVTFANATEKFTIVSPTNTPAIPPNGTPIVLSGTVPAELTAGTTYFVKAVSGATGELEATIGGGTIAISDDGSGTIYMHYGCWGPVAQATAVNTTTGVITWNGVPPAEGVAVRVKSSGTLPTGFDANDIYYVRTPSGNTCKLALQNSAVTIVIPSGVGSGNISMYCGSTYTNSKVMNIVQNVTGDTWSTTVGQNRVLLVNIWPSIYDNQRDTLATINAKYLILTTNDIDSAQYPLSRIYLCCRNVALRSASTSTTQPLVSYPISCVLKCEISNTYQPTSTALQQTWYSYGLNGGHSNTVTLLTCLYSPINNCPNCTVSLMVGAMTNAFYNCTVTTICGVYYTCSGNNNTVTEIFGCAYGSYNGKGNAITRVFGCYAGTYYRSNGNVITTISSCNIGLAASASNHTVTTIRGCSSGLQGAVYNTITRIDRCTSAIDTSNANSIGTISNCGVALQNGTACNVVLAELSGNTVDFQSYSGVSGTLISASAPVTPVWENRNAQGCYGRIISENHNRVEGAMKIFDMWGDILKTACVADAAVHPHVDPDGGLGNVIEVSNLQSNLGIPTGTAIAGTLQLYPNKLVIFDKHRIWMTAAEHTVTYKVQSTFTALAEGNLKLTARYITTDGALAEVDAHPAINTRSDQHDWTQTLAVTFTCARAGWVDLKMELAQYESGKVLYVWPTPVIT